MDRQRLLYDIHELETLREIAEMDRVGVNLDVDPEDWIVRVTMLLPDVLAVARNAVAEAPETSHG